ncbi:uncharacterized protein ARMOST_21452 [Armillaria ostoyae]|uniref:Peptidase C14 caspase domain-containing protein n=1 Tax=Armillaria ostoyae TaxID=47428 RepID=A0A284SA94_ARMOS|nr:uncharacterized protein ARMOST_21452 [Armillaria ostoyae]
MGLRTTTISSNRLSSWMSPYCQLGNFLFDTCDTVAHFRTSSVTAHKAAYKAKVLRPRSVLMSTSHRALSPQALHTSSARLDSGQFSSELTGMNAIRYGVMKYLIDDLGMPRERIQLLLGSKEHTSPDDPMYPSRTHITDMLFSLIDNPEIEERDNIIIYFSGHGSSYPCSSYYDVEKPDLETEISFSGTGYIKALCPIDRDTCDTNGKPVPDISDREFNTILTLISQAKGHHITVILDCCHSSGVSRDVPPPGSCTSPGTRQATLRDMLLTGEKNLMKFPGCPSILTKDWHPNMDSHVALTACKAYQFAKEKWVDGVGGSRVCVGVFTHSLVRLLRSGYYKAETKYEDLLLGFDKSSHQTPVVVGRYRDVRVWYQAETHYEIDTTSYLWYAATIPIVFLLSSLCRHYAV